MADKLPWFPFYVNDWETNHRVKAMGPIARSHYLILLMIQWREGCIPSDIKTLRRLLVLPSDPLVPVPTFSTQTHPESDFDLIDFEAVLMQVLECFDPDGNGGLVNLRLKSIRDEQLRIVLAKSRGGQHSAKTLARLFKDSGKTAGVESESESNINRDSKSKASTPNGALSRGTRIPEWFGVTQVHIDWALTNACPNPMDHIAAFKDYWMARAGAGGVKLDWDATFRTWLRKEKQNHGGNGNGGLSRTQGKTQRGQEAILNAARNHARERVGVEPTEREGRSRAAAHG